MAKLEVEFAGINMRNPVGVASLAIFSGLRTNAQKQADFLMRYVDRGAGYVYTPITCDEKTSPLESKSMGRFLKIKTEGFAEKEGLLCTGDVNIGINRLDTTLKMVDILKQRLPEKVPIIANMVGSGDNIESWIELAKSLEKAGVDMIELNMSCPVPMFMSAKYERPKYTDIASEDLAKELKDLGLNLILGDTPQAIGPIVEAVVNSVNVPVGVKPSPEAGFPRIVVIFKVIAKAGAKFITNINTPITIAPPNIYEDGKPLWPELDINPFAAAIGPWSRYQTYKALAAGSTFVPEVDYSAIGGIVLPTHMIESFMLGAKHIGLSSAIFWHGVKAISQFISFLEKFMDEHGYESVDQMTGIAKKYILPVDENTDWKSERVVARIDKSKCNECGICIENYCFFAISRDSSGRPAINEDLCCACGMCVAICPQEAVRLVDRT